MTRRCAGRQDRLLRRDALAGQLHDAFGERSNESLEAHPQTVTVGGRMMLKRVMGKASFATIQDRTGRIQLFLKQDAVGEEAYAAFKDWDIGDIVGATGTLFRTNAGELSVKVTTPRLLVKSLRPLADKWHGLADVEAIVAEGFERGSTNDLIAFLYYARGSAGEVRSILCLLERLPRFDPKRTNIADLKSQAESCSRQLRAWADHLQNSPIRGQRHLTDETRTSFEQSKRAEAFQAKLRRLTARSSTPASEIQDQTSNG